MKLEQLSRKLIEKHYKEVYMIHLEENEIDILDNLNEPSKVLNYNEWLNQMASSMPYIYINTFMEQMDLNRICTVLDGMEECYLVTYQTEVNGNEFYYQFVICYFDDNKKELLMTKQDCTSYHKKHTQYVNELQKDSERFRFIIKNLCEDFGEINIHTGEAYMTTVNDWKVGKGKFSDMIEWLSNNVIIPEQSEQYKEEFKLENFVASLRKNNGFYAPNYIANSPEGQKHLLINSALLSNPLNPSEEYIFSFAQDITPLKKQEEKNRQLIDISQELITISQTDKLTTLYNRAAGEKMVSDALNTIHTEEESMFLLLDIDYFKKINDSFGHSVGDHVLHYFGQSAKNIFHSSDILCRWGGDEFVIYIKNAADRKIINQLLTGIQKRMEHCMYNSTLLPVTISMGGVFLNKCKDLSNVFEAADELLYKAKKKGRRCYILGEYTDMEEK